MILRDWLHRWGLSQLKISAGFLEAEFQPQDDDRLAAWDLYIELLTRIATQPLSPNEGTEEAALASLISLFSSTRDTLKHHGPGCIRFSRIAVSILNQVLRPKAAKWHARLRGGNFQSEQDRQEFREDLDSVHPLLINYAGALANLANVEDLTVWK